MSHKSREDSELIEFLDSQPERDRERLAEEQEEFLGIFSRRAHHRKNYEKTDRGRASQRETR